MGRQSRRFWKARVEGRREGLTAQAGKLATSLASFPSVAPLAAAVADAIAAKTEALSVALVA